MKPSVSFLIAFLFFEIFSISTINFSFCNGSTSNVGCIEFERKALLMFKQDLTDTSNRLDSWFGADGDCCKWAGVVCDNITGHVLELHLGNPHTEFFTFDGLQSNNKVEAEIDAFERSRLGGKLNPSLLDLKHLNYLDLSFNDFGGIWIPRFLGSMESLTYLNLSDAGFSGMIPHQFGNISNLQYLDLSSYYFNSFSAENLFWLSYLPLLEHLDLSHVNLSKASDWLLEINTLSSLKVLKLARCELQHFPPLSIVNFSSLVTLDLFYNRAPLIPSWVFGLSHLHFLDMSFNEIQGPIPDGLQNLSSLIHLDLTEIPSLTKEIHFVSLDLSSNNLSGPLPLIFPTSRLDLSNNNFSGSISHFVCHRMHESKETEILRLRGNFLSEELPDCWKIWPFLKMLDLGTNKFTGNLPISMGTLSELRSLRLRKNNLSGTIPASLGNCTELETLDVGENELVGTIPIWIGERLSSMLILILRSNKFHGFLPRELCNLASLQILDVACNNLSGSIPRCISNINAMVTMDSSNVRHSLRYETNYTGVTEYALLVINGQMIEYNKFLNLLRIIDLSKNNFSGEIPIEVTSLAALLSLNLSYNSFTGKIPANFGAMKRLESVDFSWNQLSGEIPQSISSLISLCYLNLSNNKLIGQIPMGGQLQTIGQTSFMGNELCGPPLPTNCISPTPGHNENDKGKYDGEHEVDWFYVSSLLGTNPLELALGFVVGFAVGFWSFVGPLIVNRRWSYMYNRFLDRLGEIIGSIVRKCF